MTDLLALADKLQRFIDMPEWPRFYMDKEQAVECVAALRARHAEIEERVE